jgi:hypothetical protein
MILSGRTLAVDETLALGLLDRIVDNADPFAAAVEEGLRCAGLDVLKVDLIGRRFAQRSRPARSG